MPPQRDKPPSGRSRLIRSLVSCGAMSWLEGQPSLPHGPPALVPVAWPRYADGLPLVLGVFVRKYIEWLCLAAWPVAYSVKGAGGWCWLPCWLPPQPRRHRGTASVLSAQKPIFTSFPEHLSSVDEEHWTAAGYYFQASSMIFCTTYNEINFDYFSFSVTTATVFFKEQKLWSGVVIKNLALL